MQAYYPPEPQYTYLPHAQPYGGGNYGAAPVAYDGYGSGNPYYYSTTGNSNSNYYYDDDYNGGGGGGYGAYGSRQQPARDGRTTPPPGTKPAKAKGSWKDNLPLLRKKKPAAGDGYGDGSGGASPGRPASPRASPPAPPVVVVDDLRARELAHARFVEDQRLRGVYINPDWQQYERDVAVAHAAQAHQASAPGDYYYADHTNNNGYYEQRQPRNKTTKATKPPVASPGKKAPPPPPPQLLQDIIAEDRRVAGYPTGYPSPSGAPHRSPRRQIGSGRQTAPAARKPGYEVETYAGPYGHQQYGSEYYDDGAYANHPRSYPTSSHVFNQAAFHGAANPSSYGQYGYGPGFGYGAHAPFGAPQYAAAPVYGAPAPAAFAAAPYSGLGGLQGGYWGAW